MYARYFYKEIILLRKVYNTGIIPNIYLHSFAHWFIECIEDLITGFTPKRIQLTTDGIPFFVAGVKVMDCRFCKDRRASRREQYHRQREVQL